MQLKHRSWECEEVNRGRSQNERLWSRLVTRRRRASLCGFSRNGLCCSGPRWRGRGRFKRSTVAKSKRSSIKTTSRSHYWCRWLKALYDGTTCECIKYIVLWRYIVPVCWVCLNDVWGGTLTEKRSPSECQNARNVMYLGSEKGFSDLWVIQTTPPCSLLPRRGGVPPTTRSKRDLLPYQLYQTAACQDRKTGEMKDGNMDEMDGKVTFLWRFFYSGLMPKAATIWHTSRSLVRPERRKKGGTEGKKRKRVTDGKQDRFCGDGGSSVCAAAALLCQITEWRSVIISLIGALPQEAKGGGGGRGPKGGGVTSLIAGKMVW